MKRIKGFTLTELMVVVAVIALLVVVLVLVKSRWTRPRRPGRRSYCAANLKSIGSGIKLYEVENDDCPPWLSNFDANAKTGDNAAAASPTSLSATALMFLIVRSGQTVDLFRCPTDENATKMATTKHGIDSDYYWDFCDTDIPDPGGRDCTKVSYSYQAPLYDPDGKSYSSGYTANSNGGLAIMADKTPGFDGKTPCTNWTGSLSENQRKAGMSRNHNSGDWINVLFADGHVKGGERADVGVGNDNIYSASNNAEEGTQGAGSTTLTHHLSEDDSFLIGPIKAAGE